MSQRVLGWTLCLAIAAAASAGCGTTRTSNTARTATEQMLISDAIDRTVQSINFAVLAGQTVYFDERNLVDVVDKGYLTSSLRQHLLASGCILKEARDQADYVVEPRVGAVGTDNFDLLFGIPAVNVPQVALAPTLPAAIPEIPFAKRRDQRGIAKVAVFAYRRETGEPVWQSGIVLNESTANDIWVFGAGPFKRGTIYDRLRSAKGKSKEEQLADKFDMSPRLAAVGEEAFFATPRLASAAPASGPVVQASAEFPVATPPVETEPREAGPPVIPPRPLSEAPPPQ